MRTLVVGNGPIAVFLATLLSHGPGDVVLASAKSQPPLISPSRPAGSHRLLPIPVLRRLLLSDLDTALRRERFETLVIAMAPWRAFDLLRLLERQLCPQTDTYISGNGYWWPFDGHPTTRRLGAVSVTCHVEMAKETQLRLTPVDAGLIAAPRSDFTRYLQLCARQVGIAMILTDEPAAAVATKTVVNTPLALQYGVCGRRLSELVRDRRSLLCEARQLAEIGGLLAATETALVPAPGFPTAQAMALAGTISAFPTSDASTEFAAALEDLSLMLSAWRGSRVPASGKAMRSNTPHARDSIEWQWGRLVSHGKAVGHPLPVIESLLGEYRRGAAETATD
jgi:ketopantoate reductase